MPGELLPVGVLGRPYGLKGELRVTLFDPSSEVLLEVQEVFLVSPTPQGELSAPRAFPVQCRRQGQEVLLRLEQVTDRTGAEGYRGSQVLVPLSALPAPAEGEYYDFALVGLDVRAADGSQLGQVVAVEHPPANDVLVIHLPAEEAFTDLPMVKDFLLEVNLAQRYVVVEIPPGLPVRKRR